MAKFFNKAVNVKNEVLVRAYIVLAMVVVTAVVIFTRAVNISVVEGNKWRSMGDSLYVDMRPVEAQRGNILAADGSFLVTSLPLYELRVDLKSTGMSDADFNSNVDSLAWNIATYVQRNYTPQAMRELLVQKRKAGDRYWLLKKNASYEEMKRIKNFPLFRLGKFRGGLIVLQKSERKKPYKLLANRTLGYVRDNAQPVGLEGYFDKELAGKKGKQSMLRINSDMWIPINDLKEIEPQDGHDILTTIDVNIQDIAENALYKAMNYHQAEKGCAIVMEVETGAIKAIANLGRVGNNYFENYNYAIGAATEPGSTMKLASVMAMMEDGLVTLDDTVHLTGGKTTFYKSEMRDASHHGVDTATLRQAFEFSSNVGIARMVNKYYGKDEKSKERFVERLKDFHLHLPTGIRIEGEGKPYIKSAGNKEDNWSGTTLPWMAIGYEMTITPLQLLTFYNGVANHGVVMKPFLVSEIQKFGETLESFEPEIIDNKLASRKTIMKARELLEGVVENGTANNLKTSQYRFAGKTGTAQLNYQRLQSRTSVGGYQASFVGYFPAENPKYSCIVMIANPQSYGIYGSEVAGPVFRDIADKMYASRPELQTNFDEDPKPVFASNKMPQFMGGHEDEVEFLLQELKIDYTDYDDNEWTLLKAENDSLKLLPKRISDNSIPSVKGLGLRDAVYILENLGLKVEVVGAGKVNRQSILPGTRANGQRIKIYLS
ncbi:MAG: penicillin-binding protein [Saprospiraceae bacterium]